MTYPTENTCGCGHCPACIAWDLQYSLEEWERVSREELMDLGHDPQVEAELLSAPLRPSQEYFLDITESGDLLPRRDEDHMPWASHMNWKYR